jgi:hypothetical protein
MLCSGLLREQECLPPTCRERVTIWLTDGVYGFV